MDSLLGDILYEEMCMDLRGFPDDDPRPFIAQTCHYLGIPQGKLRVFCVSLYRSLCRWQRYSHEADLG